VEILLESVAKSFVTQEGERVPAVEDVSLAVPAGTICCLVGPTGCGKSTILRMAAGLEEPDRGRVAAPDHHGGGAGESRIGLLTQHHTLFPWLTTIENVALPLRIRGENAARAHGRCRPILEELGLGDSAARYPYELSGGMQQRAALARLLASSARCWLLDEPFNALDERTRQRLQGLVVELASARRIAVLFVTHAIDEAVSIADRVHVISAAPGRVVATLDLPEERPRDRLSAAFAGRLESIRRTLEEAIR
jgi:NitT/TauT family transport system ATP-binding protein